MCATSRRPPSRRGKRQIIAYLPPDVVEMAHAWSTENGTSIGGIVAHAINTALKAYGRKPLVSTGHQRLVRRNKARAEVRMNGPACRTGKRAISGWYPEREVDAVALFAEEVGMRIQDIVDMGLQKVLEDNIPLQQEAQQTA